MVTKPKRKRSKIMLILLFPVLMVIFLMGFCIYSMGDQKTPRKIISYQRQKTKEDTVTFLPAILEEEHELTH